MEIALLALTAALVAALLVVTLRPRDGERVERRLEELSGRLDRLVEAQQDLPRTVAEESAQQARSLAHVREQLVQLAEATQRLEAVGRSVAEVQDLLKVPQLRGTLGEVWLEELLRQVFPEPLYEMQYTFESGERVDAVLRVGERLVPIDAKFPLEACQRMLAVSGADAQRERRAFQRSLKSRIDEIADKYIRPEQGTFDFALMYIPAENVYYEGLIRHDASDEGGVVQYALERRVLPVSPNTLYAYLSAVVHGLRGLEVERRAREILGALGQLEQQLDRFQRAFEVAGRHLDNAQRQYQESGRLLQDMRERLTGLQALDGGD